jgi:hypothetical protein
VKSIDLPAGTVQFSIQAPISVCESQNIVLKTTPPNESAPWTWTWQGPGITTNTMLQQVTASNLTPGNYTYSVRVTNIRGCSTTQTTSVQVLPRPTAVIAGPATVCLDAHHQVYQLEEAYTSFQWKINGGEITSASADKAFLSVDWENNHPNAWVSVTVANGNCTDSDTLSIDFTNEKALPEGDIILKPSGDILFFAADTLTYPDYLQYEWGALKVTNPDNGLTEPVDLPEKIDGITVFKNRQYYYVGTPGPDTTYYVKISLPGSGCETWCYWPSNPFARMEQAEAPPADSLQRTVPAKAFPNPSAGAFDLLLPEIWNGPVVYRLYYATGALAASGEETAVSGYMHLDFTDQGLPAGFYHLSLFKKSFGAQSNLKIIIH